MDSKAEGLLIISEGAAQAEKAVQRIPQAVAERETDPLATPKSRLAGPIAEGSHTLARPLPAFPPLGVACTSRTRLLMPTESGFPVDTGRRFR